MKALALAAALALAPAAASAGTLIAGAVRDSDGFAVAGATVTARVAGGAIAARGTTAVDGTFALDADGTATTLEVSCRFCVSQTVALTADPPAIVVVRYAALRDRTPSADDIAALPYDRAGQVATLVPYTVVTEYGGISDRGLAAGAGAIAIDGIAYYRISDGRSFLNLVPLGALASLAAQPAGFAARYGQPAQGGLFNVATLGAPELALRGGGDGTAGALRLTGTAGAASFDESFDGTVVRRATGRLDAPFAGGALTFVAAAAGNGSDATNGATLQFTKGLANADAFASLSAAQSRSALAPAAGSFAAGSDVHFDAHLRGRGPNGWEIGVRDESSVASGPANVSGTQGEGALYVDRQHVGPQTTLSGAIAFQGDIEATGPARWHTNAVLPSFSFEERLGSGFALNASTTAAIRDPYLEQFGGYTPVYVIPAYFVRSNVVDAGLSYTDGRRIRVDGVAYAQRAGDLNDTIAGLGIDAAWQVTPQLALRTWALAASTGADPNLPPALAYANPSTLMPLRRQVVWLTYRNGLRVDLLDRGAGLDGSVELPIGHGFRFVAGTYAELPGRVVTVELRATR